MNELLYYLSINNAIYALFIIIALIISFLLNKIIDITPMGSNNDLSLEYHAYSSLSYIHT